MQWSRGLLPISSYVALRLRCANPESLQCEELPEYRPGAKLKRSMSLRLVKLLAGLARWGRDFDLLATSLGS